MFVANLMLASVLAQVAAAGQLPDQDPAVLVAHLGANRYAERELAAAALEGLGRAALPALRGARGSRDLEIRTRAAGLVQKIEGALLTQPTRVRLDFNNVPLADAVRALSQQAGFKLALFPENLPRFKVARVTLHESEPVDFWRAVDQLREVAGLQYNPGMNGSAGQREPTFSQADGAARAVAPISDHGPFRVSLLGLHYQRDVNFDAAGQNFKVPARPAARPAVPIPAAIAGSLEAVANVQFSARLLVAAEPRLALSQDGPLQTLEAVDNRGNSLIPLAGNGPAFNRFAGYFGVANGPVIQLQAPLQRPDSAGESIKKFRGVIPLSIASRKPEPLVFPLNHGLGKTVENSEVRLTVHDIRALPNSRNTLLEISVRANDVDLSTDQGDVAGFRNVLQRTDPQHLQIEVVDSLGQLIPWFPSAADAETAHVTLTLTNLTQTTQPKELRYYTLIRATVNVPFEFKDLPMP